MTAQNPDIGRGAVEDRRYRRMAKRLSVMLVAFALSGNPSAYGENNVRRDPVNSAKLAGAFVNWGAVGREKPWRIGKAG